jgi:hypothetical protein
MLQCGEMSLASGKAVVRRQRLFLRGLWRSAQIASDTEK